jgi:hypothetical protein
MFCPSYCKLQDILLAVSLKTEIQVLRLFWFDAFSGIVFTAYFHV